MPITWADLAIILGYFCITFALGAYFTRYMKTQKDFFLASRAMPWWMVACSTASTDIGTETYIGVTGIVASLGLVWLNYDWLMGSIVPCALAAWIFMGYYWRSKSFTIPEFMEKRYDPSMRLLWSVLFVVVRTLTLGVIIYTMALPMALIMGWPWWLSLILSAGIAAAYTILGGLTAVMMTDVFQFIVMTLCGLGVVFFALEAVGGWSGLYAALPRNMFHVVLTRAEGNPDTWWGAMFFGILSLSLAYWCTDQNIVQKSLSCKSEKDARIGIATTALFKVPMTFIWGIIGLCAAVLLPQMIAINPDSAMPEIVTSLLPIGAFGVAITALFAAGMSSCASLLNSMSAVITRDIYGRFIIKNKDERHYVWVGRIMVIILIILGSLFACVVFPVFGAAYIAWQSVLSYVQFPLFITLVIAIFYKRATAIPAIIGLASGSVISFAMDTFLGPILFPYWWSFVWAGWIGAIFTVLITIIGSNFTKPYSKEKIKGLCYGTLEKEREVEKVGIFDNWKFWCAVSLSVGIALTLIFWLVV
jgi:SSS family solute:Na+ symporter